ncbi:MAG: alpha/beta hydrolase [Desulfobacterales bacterium]|nr:alpha/beta hydrolase [Desulfobacterales bacterium]
MINKNGRQKNRGLLLFIYCGLGTTIALAMLAGYLTFQGGSPLSVLYRSFQLGLKIQGVDYRTLEGEKYRIPIYENRQPSGTPVVLLHGFGADAAATWLKIFPGFKSDFHVIAPQMLYAEYSRILRQNYQLSVETDRLDDLADTLGIREFHLVGYSLGGWVAITYTLVHPQRVKSLILINPVAVKMEIPDFVFTVPSNRKTAEQFLSRLFHSPPPIPGFLLDIYAENCRKNARAYLRAVNKLLKSYTSPEPLLNRIVCPTLVIWAEQDQILPPTHGQIISSQIPNSSVQLVRNAGHALLWENPGPVIDSILNHLNPF